MKKKKIRFESVLQIINTIIVVGCLVLYGFRFFYYKSLSEADDSSKTDDSTTILQAVTDSGKISLAGDGELVLFEDEVYRYVGKPANNYLYYSGHLFRIISVDDDEGIKMISEDLFTVSFLQENAPFEETELYTFMNQTGTVERSGIIEKTLVNFSSKKALGSEITLLTLEEYVNADGKEGFINNGTSFWINELNEEKYCFITSEGKVSSSYSNALMEGVRPVITISPNTLVLEGNGTITNPYIILNNEVDTMSDIYVGEYVNYSNHLWRVVENGENTVLLFCQTEDDAIKDKYGNSTSFTSNVGLSKTLNSTFLKSLNDYEQYLVNNTWYKGYYSGSEYSLFKSFETQYESYVSIPTPATLLLEAKGQYLFAMTDDMSTKIVYTYNNGLLYGEKISNECTVYPMICIKGDLKIQDGSGSLEDPYTFEVAQNEN